MPKRGLGIAPPPRRIGMTECRSTTVTLAVRLPAA